MRIFYSWQSDLPNRTNRTFIEKALEHAAKSLRADPTLSIEPAIDRDTLGLPGAVEIARSIQRKIYEADAVVADVSITGSAGPKSRPTPNPNVLAEVGYAAGVLRWERVLLVCNLALGAKETLPFDLRHMKVLGYHDADTEHERGPAREELGAAIAAELATIAKARLTPTLREIEAEHVRDRTANRSVTPPKNLKYMSGVLGWKELEPGMLEDSAAEVAAFGEKLRSLPLPASELLSIALQRSVANGGRAVLYDDLLHATELEPTVFKSLLDVLEYHSLVLAEDDMDDGLLYIKPRALRSGWPFLQDLVTFCGRTGVRIADVIVGLQMDLLDETKQR
ncbi:MAG TPA: hypothetical protein VGK67_15880 [Myxococcales bacterium]|jgi:hypothetical protein